MKQVLSGTCKSHLGDLETGKATAAASLMCVRCAQCGCSQEPLWHRLLLPAPLDFRLLIAVVVASLLAGTVATLHLLDDLTGAALLFLHREKQPWEERGRGIKIEFTSLSTLGCYCTEEMPETVFRKVLLELELIQLHQHV